MNVKNKKIGIWGFGLVGRSAARFLNAHGAQVQVIERNELNTSQRQLINGLDATYTDQTHIDSFLENNELIIPSPGIDLRPYQKYTDKFIGELDLFAQYFTKPVVAITGTVGKTTVTTLLSHALRMSCQRVLTGGNIGTPLLDLINKQHECDIAVIELSSFQLELNKTFAPDLAIWTNFYPNHLDRHSSVKNYLNAKKQILNHQTKTQDALLSCQLRNMIQATNVQSNVRYFNDTTDQHAHYHLQKGMIKKNNECILTLDQLPQQGFVQNWLIVCAALDMLGHSATDLSLPAENKELEHRLEHVTRINNIDFYNDSKSTIAQATLAAVHKFPDKNIILILGGLSKGVDRENMIKLLPANVGHIVCFGAEAEQLHRYCTTHAHQATDCDTLEHAVELGVQKAQPNDIILFSPGGASFDLFANYKQRGKRFKSLVLKEL